MEFWVSNKDNIIKIYISILNIDIWLQERRMTKLIRKCKKRSYLVAVVILASLRSLALLPLFAVPAAAADFSMPNSSCITLDLFGCPTLLLLPAFEEEVGTAAEVVEDTAVVSLLLVESSCCFLPGLSKPVKVDDSLLASKVESYLKIVTF